MTKKNIILVVVAFLLLSVVASGCSKKDSTDAEVPAEQQVVEETAKNPDIAEEPVEITTGAPLEEPLADPEVDEIEEEEPASEGSKAPEEHSTSSGDQPVPQEAPVQITELPVESQSAEPEKASGPSIQLIKTNGEIFYMSLDDMKDRSELHFSGSFYWLNSFGSTGHTDFKGVKLWTLLEAMEIVDSSSSRVKVIASDGYSMDFDISQIKRMDYIDETNQDVKLPIIIAWEENGEAYDPSEGAPFKLVVGQKEPGDINKPQWVSNIEKIIVE